LVGGGGNGPLRIAANYADYVNIAPPFGKAGQNFDRGHEAKYRLPVVPRACGLRARRSETGGAKILSEARAEISISGDIESCARTGKFTAISPNQHDPRL